LSGGATAGSPTQAILVILVTTLGFLLCGGGAKRVVGRFFKAYAGRGPREQTFVVLIGAVAGQVLAPTLLIIIEPWLVFAAASGTPGRARSASRTP